jgi:hypothetical protein
MIRNVRLDCALAATGGLILGLAFALPVQDVSDACPPVGEGYGQCALQKSWLPAVMLVVLCVSGAVLLTRLVAAAPGLVASARAWYHRPPTVEPAFDEDPLLVAATWGRRYRDERPDAPLRRQRRWELDERLR